LEARKKDEEGEIKGFGFPLEITWLAFLQK